MTTQEFAIKQAEVNLIKQLRASIKAANELHNASFGYEWDGEIECEFDERDLGAMLKSIYNALLTGNKNDDTYQDGLFK